MPGSGNSYRTFLILPASPCYRKNADLDCPAVQEMASFMLVSGSTAFSPAPYSLPLNSTHSAISGNGTTPVALTLSTVSSAAAKRTYRPVTAGSTPFTVHTPLRKRAAAKHLLPQPPIESPAEAPADQKAQRHYRQDRNCLLSCRLRHPGAARTDGRGARQSACLHSGGRRRRHDRSGDTALPDDHDPAADPAETRQRYGTADRLRDFEQPQPDPVGARHIQAADLHFL